LRNHGSDLARDLVQLVLDLVQDGVNLGLVVDIDLWDGKQSKPGRNDQSHGIEPASNISQYPQRQAKLDRVKHVFHQEQASQLQQGGVQLGRGGVGKLVHLVLRNSQGDVRTFAEGIGHLLLEERHHDISVDLERQNCQQSRQGHIGHHTDQGEVAYRNQGETNRAKDEA